MPQAAHHLARLLQGHRQGFGQFPLGSIDVRQLTQCLRGLAQQIAHRRDLRGPLIEQGKRGLCQSRQFLRVGQPGAFLLQRLLLTGYQRRRFDLLNLETQQIGPLRGLSIRAP